MLVINFPKRGFKKVSNAPEGVQLPKRKTKGSACYDFYLPNDVTVPAHGFTDIIPTYIKAYMSEDDVLLLHIRSSVGLLKHITLANGTGIIDSDYYNNQDNEGNIGFVLQNNGDTDQTFKAGERVLQGMFIKYQVADNDETTEMRTGGVGSTGEK